MPTQGEWRVKSSSCQRAALSLASLDQRTENQRNRCPENDLSAERYNPELPKQIRRESLRYLIN
jgi:hypothetical protein